MSNQDPPKLTLVHLFILAYMKGYNDCQKARQLLGPFTESADAVEAQANSYALKLRMQYLEGK